MSNKSFESSSVRVVRWSCYPQRNMADEANATRSRRIAALTHPSYVAISV
jgi:hypothetical protein